MPDNKASNMVAYVMSLHMARSSRHKMVYDLHYEMMLTSIDCGTHKGECVYTVGFVTILRERV